MYQSSCCLSKISLFINCQQKSELGVNVIINTEFKLSKQNVVCNLFCVLVDLFVGFLVTVT